MRLFPIAVLASSLALSGCSPLRALNAFVPSGNYERTADLAYGSAPRQRLDVYRPQNQSGPSPVVVFFYGGRWQDGSREDYKFAAQALTARGLVVVVPDYRLYPEVKFPTFVEDGARAVEWVRANVAQHGGDPRRIFLAGHSAGAHIAMLLALDERYLQAVGVPRDAVSGVIGLAGPYDFLPFTSDDVRQLMGPPEQWPQTQPIAFADAGAPPTLLIHGLRDETVNPANSKRLAQRLEELGRCVHHIEYADADHTDVLLALAAPLRSEKRPVAEEIERFVKTPCAKSEPASPSSRESER